MKSDTLKKEANVDFYNVLIDFYKFCVTGLNIAIDDGSFDKLFYGDKSNKEMLDKVNFNKMKIFELENPYLTPETKKLQNNKKYIFQIKQ